MPLLKHKVEEVNKLGLIGKGAWYVPTYMIEGDPERGIEATVECAPLRKWVEHSKADRQMEEGYFWTRPNSAIKYLSSSAVIVSEVPSKADKSVLRR